MKRDVSDIQSFFHDKKPFRTKKYHFRTTELVSDKSVNVDSAMVGVSVANHKFTKENQMNTLVTAVYVSNDGAKIETDPKQLYQRLLISGIDSIESQTLFQYELGSYPPSLFDQKLLIRISDKVEFQNSLVKRVTHYRNMLIVFDGYEILHQYPMVLGKHLLLTGILLLRGNSMSFYGQIRLEVDPAGHQVMFFMAFYRILCMY